MNDNFLVNIIEKLEEKKRELKNTENEVKALEETLKTHFKKEINANEKINIDTGKHTLTAVYTSRLDGAKISNAFPPEKYPELYKTVLDTKQVNNHVAPKVLDEYRNSSVSWRIKESK